MLIGHEDKINLFNKLIELDGLGHAYLFFGDSGIGKSLFAKNLAHFLESGKFENYAQNAAPLIDALFISVAEGNTIGIDEVRELKNFLWQTPLVSSRRLAVIDNAEELTGEAQGALLKIVEEPPTHGLIIFIAHDSQALFPPLRSRLTKVYFRRLSEEKIRVFLKSRGFAEAVAAKAAARSFGRIGLALQLTEGKKREAEEDLEAELQEAIIDLWFKDREYNSKKLAWLLERESSLKRYNLNQKLQRKAIKTVFSHS